MLEITPIFHVNVTKIQLRTTSTHQLFTTCTQPDYRPQEGFLGDKTGPGNR